MSADRVGDGGAGSGQGGRQGDDGPAREVPPGDEQPDVVDEAERESFPASDPASSWAGVDRAPDEPSGARDADDPA